MTAVQRRVWARTQFEHHGASLSLLTAFLLPMDIIGFAFYRIVNNREAMVTTLLIMQDGAPETIC